MFPWTESDPNATKRMERAAIVVTLAAVFFCGVFHPGVGRAESIWSPLVDRLVNDGFERDAMEALFRKQSLEFSPQVMARKMNSLVEIKLSTKAPGPKKEAKAMDRYLNPILIAGAYGFLREHSGEFLIIEKEYGVPGEVLTALMLIETKLGTQVGKHNAMNILASMALAKDFELIRSHIKRKDLSPDMMEWLVKRTGQKGNWGYEELKSLLKYSENARQDPLNIPSSMYGAIGKCQFMPTSAMHYGVDGTGDGNINLFNTVDALHSMANFVKKHGWKEGLDRQAQLKVIYRYNHSESYALTILAVADKLKKTNEFFGN